MKTNLSLGKALITVSNHLVKIGDAFKKINFKAYQARPEILMGVGIASVVVAAVVACVKTKDAAPVIDNCTERVEELDYIRSNPMAEENPSIKEYFRVYRETAWELIKIYAVPAALMTGGVLCIIGSNADMRHRNARLLADLTATQALFKEYRDRVKEAIGEENEQKLYFGAETGEILVDKVDESTGELVKGKKNGTLFAKNPGSMYARNFTPETSVEYDCRSYADTFLDLKIKHLNWLLTTVPFITLNEVYDVLGFKNGYGKCPEGMTVGWCAHPKINRGDREIVIERMVGYEPVHDNVTGEVMDYKECLRLDFNCYPLEGLI